jgi:hypothetical protein
MTTTRVLFGLAFLAGITTAALAAPVAPETAVESTLEDQLAAAEKANGGFGQRGAFIGDRRAYPYLAYFEVFDKAYANAQKTATPTNASDATQSAPIARDGGVSLLTVGMLGSFAAAGPAPSLHSGWLGVGIVFGVLDFLTTDHAQIMKQAQYANEAKANEKRRLLPIMTPSIHFVRWAPGVEEREELYAATKADAAFVSGLGLDCEPALPHGNGSTAFVGAARRDANYTRKYVCGYKAGEKVADDEIENGVKDYTVSAFSIGDSLARFSLSNLPAMSKLKAALGRGTFDLDRELGRVVYEKVKDNVGPEWTIVFTAPNERGSMAVFVARNGVIAEFPLPH